jgi:hypothetical protein
MGTGAIAIAFVLSVCLVIAVTAYARYADRRAQERRRRIWDTPDDQR